MIVVDASVWVSRLVPQDVHHQASRRWLQEQAGRGVLFIAPAILLAEVAGAIARRTDEPELARRAVESLLRLPNLRLIAVDARLGMSAARLAGALRLKGADALYVALAHNLQIPLVTWDREHAERAGKLISVRMPETDP